MTKTSAVIESKETEKVSFKLSTGEDVICRINDAGNVHQFEVTASGEDIEALLGEQYHYYPVCNYLSEVTGETVTVDELLDVFLSKDPTNENTETLFTSKREVKKESISYIMTVTQNKSIDFCTMYITIQVD